MSANNIVIKLLRLSLSGYHGEIFHVRCSCHVVNLIIKERLNLVRKAIQKICQCIVYLSNNSSRVVFFKIMYRRYEKRVRIFELDKPHR